MTMNRTLFAILTILFNCYGVPCFILGKKEAGIKRIVFGVLSCSVIMYINLFKGIMLGIKIFKMTDEEFEAQKESLVDGYPA